VFRLPAGARNNLSPKAQSYPSTEYAPTARTIKPDSSLIVISDMIEFTRDYSQYARAGDLSFSRYKQSPAYLKFRTDLHGATVAIRYVNRQVKGQPLIDGTIHMDFWKSWILENGGSWGGVKRLQGA
jgi:hypothetical protein